MDELPRACRKCATVKPADDFVRDRSTRTGRRIYCKKCMRAYYSRWDKENAERRAGYSKLWRERHPEEHRRSRRGTALKRLYGITLDQFDTMRARQGGLCACCGSPPSARGLVVDHDHKTGVVRGLLCCACNRTIGHAKEDPVRLLNAVTYLREKFG